jgi:hypothetical protein
MRIVLRDYRTTEGRHAAQMDYSGPNPYPAGTESHDLWAKGFAGDDAAGAIPYICEIVPTQDLREGDVIINNGHKMTLGPIKSRVDESPRDPCMVYWSTAVVDQPGGAGDVIPLSWYGKDSEGHATWQIQGNHRAQWCRVIPEA